MASVSSVSSSSSSLFAGKNIITGLSSGLDTESMIENSVKGYQLKVNSLQQQQTKVEWKQDAVREHIDSLDEFIKKYTGASSKTNLSSASFFADARTTSVSGTHAGKVSASGQSTSDLEVLSATMAKATKYTISASRLGQLTGAAASSGSIDWGSTVTYSETSTTTEPVGLKGTLTLQIGGKDKVLQFDGTDKVSNNEELAELINKKLGLERTVDAVADETGIKLVTRDYEVPTPYLENPSSTFTNSVPGFKMDANSRDSFTVGDLESVTMVSGNVGQSTFKFSVNGSTKTLTFTADDTVKSSQDVANVINNALREKYPTLQIQAQVDPNNDKKIRLVNTDGSAESISVTSFDNTGLTTFRTADRFARSFSVSGVRFDNTEPEPDENGDPVPIPVRASGTINLKLGDTAFRVTLPENGGDSTITSFSDLADKINSQINAQFQGTFGTDATFKVTAAENGTFSLQTSNGRATSAYVESVSLQFNDGETHSASLSTAGSPMAFTFTRNLNETTLKGSLELNYGEGKSKTISFSNNTVTDAAGLANVINSKLGADFSVKAVANGNTIQFQNVTGDSSAPYFSASSLSYDDDSTTPAVNRAISTAITGAGSNGLTVGDLTYSKTATNNAAQQDLGTYLSGKRLLLGAGAGQVSVTIGDLTAVDPASRTTALVSDLQNKLNGTGITVNAEGGQIRFKDSGGSTLDVTLSGDFNDLSSTSAAAVNRLFASSSSGTGTLDIYNARVRDYTDARSIQINGTTVNFDDDTTLNELFTKINNSAAKVNVTYSKLTNDIVFTARETGNTAITMDAAAQSLFGRDGTLEGGSNAMLTALVNGKEITVQSRTNQFNLDGLTLTVRSGFETKANEEGLTFQTSANSDKIVDAVKAFVEDYNSIVRNLYDSFNTQPAKKSDKSTYNPLTEKDKEDMSESAIKAYEEKAKQGILFGDEDLKALFSSLRNAITSTNPALQQAMKEAGLSTIYSGGVTMLSLNEDKLRASLDKDPDAVKDFFADSPGYKTLDGFTSKVKVIMDKYANTSIANTGILVKKAGSKLSSVSLLSNDYLREIDKFQEQIDLWNQKMLKQVDFYTKLFSQLEQTMNTMNSQSSALSSFMGY